jgi:hypothetical protein
MQRAGRSSLAQWDFEKKTGKGLVDAEGIEPSTCRLRAECSAS